MLKDLKSRLCVPSGSAYVHVLSGGDNTWNHMVRMGPWNTTRSCTACAISAQSCVPCNALHRNDMTDSARQAMKGTLTGASSPQTMPPAPAIPCSKAISRVREPHDAVNRRSRTSTHKFHAYLFIHHTRLTQRSVPCQHQWNTNLCG